MTNFELYDDYYLKIATIISDELYFYPRLIPNKASATPK